MEGLNEKRIEDDLWGACKCWRNNIIVNFADCGIVGVHREVGPSSKRANNEGVVCVYSRSSLSSYIFSEQTSRYTERGDARRGAQNDSKNEKRMAGSFDRVSFAMYKEEVQIVVIEIIEM